MGSSGSGGPPLVITATDLAQGSGFMANWSGGHVVGQMGQEGSDAGRDGDLFWRRQEESRGAPESADRFQVYTLLWGRIDSSWIYSVTADSPENRDALLAAFVAAANTAVSP